MTPAVTISTLGFIKFPSPERAFGVWLLLASSDRPGAEIASTEHL
jgi:hypothetical protein